MSEFGGALLFMLLDLSSSYQLKKKNTSIRIIGTETNKEPISSAPQTEL